MHPRAATCPATLDPASLPRWAPVLSCVLRLRTLPPCRDGLRRCHMCYGSEPCLPAKMGSGAAICPTTPNPTSLLRWALTLSRVPRPSDLASLLRRAPALPRILWLRDSLPCQGRLQCCRVSCCLLWAACLKYKERPNWPSYAAGSRVPKARLRVFKAPTPEQLCHARHASRRHH
jgi:hypothetical protein